MYSKVFLKIHLFFALVPGIQSRPFDSNLIDRCSCAPINLKSHTTRCLWSPDQFSCSAWCPNQITHFSHSAVGPRAKVNISQIAKCGSIKSLVKCKAGTIKLKLMWSGYIHQHQDCHPYGVVSLVFYQSRNILKIKCSIFYRMSFKVWAESADKDEGNF